MRAPLLLLLAALMIGVPVARADDDDDRDRLEEARRQGAVMPLSRILDRLRAQGWPGEILELELDDDDGRIVYEIYILGRDGRRYELTVNAANGRILEIDED